MNNIACFLVWTQMCKDCIALQP